MLISLYIRWFVDIVVETLELNRAVEGCRFQVRVRETEAFEKVADFPFLIDVDAAVLIPEDLDAEKGVYVAEHFHFEFAGEEVVDLLDSLFVRAGEENVVDVNSYEDLTFWIQIKTWIQPGLREAEFEH